MRNKETDYIPFGYANSFEDKINSFDLILKNRNFMPYNNKKVNIIFLNLKNPIISPNPIKVVYFNNKN